MKYNFTSVALLGAIMATTGIASHLERDECCTVYSKKDYRRGPKQTYCLNDYQEQAGFNIEFWKDHNDHASIKCGKKVDALICPDTFELGPVPFQSQLRYACKRVTDEFEPGFKVGANQQFSDIDVENEVSSIILYKHRWDAKGVDYLSLNRDEKADIIWDKIREDETTQEFVPFSEFFNINVYSMFDERGDENDCRLKTVHSQGNVGKAVWESVGSHPYTGIFEGAESGFVRLSTNAVVVEPGTLDPETQEPVELVMLPTMAVKFLRDGMDSANAVSNFNGHGQTSYNFFENSLNSILTEFPLPEDVSIHIKEETNFVNSVGHSDFASFKQDGTKVDDPVFPYGLRYEPNPMLDFPSDTYEVPIFEYMKSIPEDMAIYKVFAMDKPEELGGQEQHIANIVLKSKLETSLWGDKYMYFRHQRHDDDFRYHPEWIQYAPADLFDHEAKDDLHPYQERRASSCPFAFLFA